MSKLSNEGNKSTKLLFEMFAIKRMLLKKITAAIVEQLFNDV